MAETGDRIGTYEVVRLIARGGMATVYEARQPALDRAVALKRLDLRTDDPSQLERFIRESRVAAAFDHPNIVHVYDFFEHEGVPYIAMEYLPRGSLRPCVGQLTPPQVFGVLEGMLAALAHAEEHGVAHRDLKPENVLITRGGAVKIADFGIAKAYTRLTGQFTAAGVAVGTPTYMAPEQALAGQVGPFTDLYAVGVMAYELLSGGPPFEGGDSPVSVMYKHVSEPPPPLTGVDPRLAAWVARLLEKAPEARPPGAAQAWAELEEVVVDTHGPYWRRHAALGVVTGEDAALVEVSGEDDALAEVAGDDDATTPPPRDDYVTVAGDHVAPPAPDDPAPPDEPVAAPPGEDLPARPEDEVAVTPTPYVGGWSEEPVIAPADDEETPVTAARAAPADDQATPVTAPLAQAVTPVSGAPNRGQTPVRRPEQGSDPSTRRRVVAGVAVVVVAGVVAAIALGGGESPDGDGAGSGAGGEPPAAQAAAPYDFDGDGTPTIVAGLPGAGAGAVAVQDAEAPIAAADDQAEFGAAVASADFDGDAHADLAIGAPGTDTGSVTVLSGSDRGLAGARSTSFPGINGAGRFGTALAAGDLDGDGYGDLAVGAPEGDGAIQLLFGGADGLSDVRSRTLRRPDGSTGRFGAVLALGDVNNDDRPDLVEAVSGEDGHSSFCAGGQDGPSACVALGVDLEGGPTSLAIGDVTGDGFGDVVQGVPAGGDDARDESGLGAPGPPGLLRIWRGRRQGPAAEPIAVTQDTQGVRGNNQARDAFGFALVVADLDGDPFADLVVGAPGEDDAIGRVTVVNGGPAGHADTAPAGARRMKRGLPFPLKQGSRFGEALMLLDVDGDGRTDLIAAAPGDGAVITLPGTTEPPGFTASGSTALELPGGSRDVRLGGSAP